MSSNRIRDSSFPATFRRDMAYLALVGIVLAIIIIIYNNL